ncbi:MAG: HAD-IA family hydrolase [Lachnospiraceae bacterium]|nr:HAD-IA family hydrolase [Lachnospiraceae bacterium]
MQKLTGIKAAFIDIDNMLLDFDAYVQETMRTGFAHFGLKPYTPDMFEVFTRENNVLWRRIEDGTLVFEELVKIRWRNIFQALGIEADGPAFERYFREALNESAIPVPGAHALLQELHGRMIVCAASNGPYMQQIHRLELGEMEQYMDYCFISEKIGASKPAGLFYERAFRELNEGRETPIRPEETVMIGDSKTSDIRGGAGFGMHTIWYDRSGKADPASCEAEYTVTSLEEIPLLIE